MSAPRPLVARHEWVLLGTVTLAWLAFLLTFALVTPAFGAPDEPAHVDAAFRLALGLGWPHGGEMHYLAAVRQIVEHPVPAVDRPTVDALMAAVPGDSPAIDPMSQNPPTYWLVAAGILRVIRFGAHDWATSVLVLRVFDVLLVTALPVLVWAAVRRVTRSPRTALVAPVLLFAVPQLAQVASGVTVWAPVILLGAVLVWLSTRVLTGDRSWWTTAGLAVAVTGLATLNALGLLAVPFVVLVFVLSPDRSWGRRALHAGVVVVAAAAVSGWWWVRTLLVSGTLLPDALRAVTTVQPYPAGGANPGAFAGRQWDGLTASFFGALGANQWPLPPVVLDTLAVVGLAVIGWSYARRTPGRRVTTILLVWPAVVLVATLAYNWRNYLGTHQGNGLQGRFLFVAIVALVLAQAVGWHALVVRPVLRRRLARLAAVGSLAIGAYGIGLTYRGAWENTQFRVTPGGLSAMAGGTLTGPYPIALVVVLFAAAAVATVVLVWRTSADPTSGPLESPPTHEPTVRKENS
ncbi:glycosyltransferase family 39 protein [Curtobacterium aurantiacum]|uniref:glycosyltransferase family 39 protein n=1 Tax=Curtobacterium aurantiacum TaxID=3236919 RepID=UPI001BE0BFBF|nr:glycosyltransferase family 39 protein [Curtobacterium flaccumfaciens]MBT1676073.1 glycosyltransferase family 39 protein [Curtobacterium flaccumfaciens pv. flaccumfaciens]